MDIYCPRCGEPWDVDSLHEAYDEDLGMPIPYAVAAKAFPRIGCGAMTGTTTTCALDPTSPRAMMAKVAMELSPHADDWASDMDDAAALGFFE